MLPRKIRLSLSSFFNNSFDHDGLGRYGDPINPNADVEALGVVAQVLKPSGILFLTVPIGKLFPLASVCDVHLPLPLF